MKVIMNSNEKHAFTVVTVFALVVLSFSLGWGLKAHEVTRLKSVIQQQREEKENYDTKFSALYYSVNSLLSPYDKARVLEDAHLENEDN